MLLQNMEKFFIDELKKRIMAEEKKRKTNFGISSFARRESRKREKIGRKITSGFDYI